MESIEVSVTLRNEETSEMGDVRMSITDIESIARYYETPDDNNRLSKTCVIFEDGTMIDVNMTYNKFKKLIDQKSKKSWIKNLFC